MTRWASPRREGSSTITTSTVWSRYGNRVAGAAGEDAALRVLRREAAPPGPNPELRGCAQGGFTLTLRENVLEVRVGRRRCRRDRHTQPEDEAGPWLVSNQPIPSFKVMPELG